MRARRPSSAKLGQLPSPGGSSLVWMPGPTAPAGWCWGVLGRRRAVPHDIDTASTRAALSPGCIAAAATHGALLLCLSPCVVALSRANSESMA